MNFNFGEVLTRAGQITWKYKMLWISGIIIGLIGILPTSVSLMFTNPFSSFAVGDQAEINQRMVPMLLVNGLIFLLSIASIPVYIIGMSLPSLATCRLEMGSKALAFGELIMESLKYFWRVLGIFLLVWVGMFVVVIAFMACIGVLSVITLGLGVICAFPLFILFIPLAILSYSFTEQGVSAVVVDDLGISDALQRAWTLVKKNFGVMALMSIIIYLASMIVGMVISVPMMIPMFGFISSMGVEPDFEAFDKIFRNMTWWMLAFSPLYAVFQGILLAFMQSAWTLTYMRLTRKPVSSDVTTIGSVSPVVPDDDADKTVIARPNA